MEALTQLDRTYPGTLAARQGKELMGTLANRESAVPGQSPAGGRTRADRALA